MNSRMIDLTETNVNIDALLDVFVETQKANGMDPMMEECEFDIDNDGKITKVQTKKEDKKESAHCSGNCDGGCSHHCHPEKKSSEDGGIPWYMQNRLGLFEDSMSPELEDQLEDDDDIYVCEYCSDIGYKKEYKSYLCDTCNVCETCPEFENEECSGCTFSMYRTGRPYSAELASRGEEVALEDDERLVLKDIRDGVQSDTERREPDLSFTILDYDHKY